MFLVDMDSAAETHIEIAKVYQEFMFDVIVRVR